MTIERWTHKLYTGEVETATIKSDGDQYIVDGTEGGVFGIYKTYTWARKSLERYGYELAETKIVLY